MNARRSLWGTRFGFYLAAIGSAFGLGNLWRFPYVVVENGGGAFVLLYTFLALSIGLPLLIGELMLGKLTRQSAVQAMTRLQNETDLRSRRGGWWSNRRAVWPLLGILSVFASLLVLSYYAVISGWVLHFLMQYTLSPLISKEGFDPDNALLVLKNSGTKQLLLTSVHLILTVIVVVKGVQEGIEKWVGNLMPVFVILLGVLVVQSLSLPTAGNALRFLFYPDFSRLTSSALIHAVGHVCFTLSVGFGTMITFGSYLNDDTKIPSAGFRVATLDTLISLFAGLLIFPIVIAGSFSVSGPEVLFQTLPRLLMNLKGGYLFGITFFLCLYLAALGASIGLLESIAANFIDVLKWPRQKATWVSGLIAFAISIFPAFGTTLFRNVTYNGRGILEILDAFLINGLLPIIAVGFGLTTSLYLKSELKKREFINDDSLTTQKLYSHWMFALTWLAPVVIVMAFLIALVGENWPPKL